MIVVFAQNGRDPTGGIFGHVINCEFGVGGCGIFVPDFMSRMKGWISYKGPGRKQRDGIQFVDDSIGVWNLQLQNFCVTNKAGLG